MRAGSFLSFKSLVKWGQALLAAFQFLTRIPIPVAIPFEPPILRRSVAFYPLTGAVIGVLLSGAGAGLAATSLPPLAAAVLVLLLWVFLTGGLHLDGLMDTADGILSHRSRERMLEIMKDSRVGAMGVIACVLQLLLKVSLLSAWTGEGRWSWQATVCLAIVPIWSRWFMAVAIAFWPHAKPGEGLASLFQGVKGKHVMASLLIGAIASAAVLTGGYSLQRSVMLTAGALILCLLTGALLAGWMTRKLGGLTGDTYGTLNEILETVLLGAAVIVTGIGSGG